MKIFVKSRGNLREQDYIYWQACSSSSAVSVLVRPALIHGLNLIDLREPSLLLFAQHETYHLLVSGLLSHRKEPSSPGCICNTILITEIDSERVARAIAVYVLEFWHEFAEALDQAIVVDDHPDTICGYRLDCPALFDRLEAFYNCESVEHQQQVTLPKTALPYGGIKSQEWLTLVADLQRYRLPQASNLLRNEVLITRVAPASLARYQLCNARQSSKKSGAFPAKELEMTALTTALLMLAMLTYLIWKN